MAKQQNRRVYRRSFTQGRCPCGALPQLPRPSCSRSPARPALAPRSSCTAPPPSCTAPPPVPLSLPVLLFCGQSTLLVEKAPQFLLFSTISPAYQIFSRTCLFFRSKKLHFLLFSRFYIYFQESFLGVLWVFRGFRGFRGFRVLRVFRFFFIKHWTIL